jgi:thiol-disulfide isomerase/thioredoxin
MRNQARFMFFYAPWCPHCRNAQTPWSSFKELTKNSHYTYGGKDIVFEDINAEIDKGKAALYGITAYPTFKVETSEKVYEMKGRPSVDTFRSFLKSSIGDEKLRIDVLLCSSILFTSNSSKFDSV